MALGGDNGQGSLHSASNWSVRKHSPGRGGPYQRSPARVYEPSRVAQRPDRGWKRSGHPSKAAYAGPSVVRWGQRAGRCSAHGKHCERVSEATTVRAALAFELSGGDVCERLVLRSRMAQAPRCERGPDQSGTRHETQPASAFAR
jgi:hypothetical protein